ncbi:hypothetical protein FA13DRAFT_1745277 [Coprinellus micaceus]|uniref:NACHT domain-containing protein n=1 Tax=Coprinellus micaceus TaxID=71717 RepID=A0A4Y7SB80_COPMI|nr:hypothetical protein FA13DRAFT_1745277 [Coprinellus micaceus]
MAENPTANDLNATGGIAPQISDFSLPSIAGSMAEGLGSSRERVSERDAKEIHHHYYAPVHNVGKTNNAAFGPNHGTVTQSANQASQLDLAILLDPIPDASHTRNRQLAPPNSSCLPGTRAKVIGKILSWARSTFFTEGQHILWVFGYAGCGKSAIAQAVADQLSEDHRLAAAFFFFRGAGDRSRMSKFASTLACQVAATVPGTAEHIGAALRARPGLLNSTTSLIAQLKYLVYDPIRAVSAKWYRLSGVWKPFIVIVDGLDECGDNEDTTAFIKDLISLFERKPGISLRFLITSRVEDHLHQQLHRSPQVRLLDLVEHTSHGDIEAALDAAIRDASGGRVLDACGKEWLSRSDKERLIKHIGKSFIFMTTIVKVLFAPSATDGLTPAARLPMVLNMDPGCGPGGPGFDDLYTSILESSQSLLHFHDIISVIALSGRALSVAEIAMLLDIKIADVVVVLVTLHSIVQVPGNDRTPVTLWHTSLRDFLTSEARSGTFHASPSLHRRLTYRCISLSAPSTAPHLSSPSEYPSGYATHHWKHFLSTVENDINALQHEVDQIVAHLEGTFPATFHNVAAVYFHLDRKSYKELYPGAGSPASLVCRLFPEAGGEAEGIVEILDGVLAGEGPFQVELLAHMQQSRPMFFDTGGHLEIVMRGIPLLARRSSALTNTVALRESERYLLANWPRHLALAIQVAPQHPAFDITTPERVSLATPGREALRRRFRRVLWGGFGHYDVPQLLPLPTQQAVSSFEFARGVIENTVGQEGLLTAHQWNWEGSFPKGTYTFNESSVTVYDIFEVSG